MEDFIDIKKQPKTNKERSKTYRKRKKNYIATLEQKLSTLEEQNEELKTENERLSLLVRSNGPVKKVFTNKLEENQDYIYNYLHKKVRKDKDSVRHTMIHQAYEKVMEWSPERISLLKSLFSKILDNILSVDARLFHSSFKGMTVKEFVKKQRSKKRNMKYAKKYNSAKDYFLEYQFSETMVNIMEKQSAEYLKCLKNIQKIAQKLVKLRNETINVWKQMYDMSKGSDCAVSFAKTDMINMGELMDRLKKTEFLKPNISFDIPKKDHDRETYDAGEMTDEHEILSA